MISCSLLTRDTHTENHLAWEVRLGISNESICRWARKSKQDEQVTINMLMLILIWVDPTDFSSLPETRLNVGHLTFYKVYTCVYTFLFISIIITRYLGEYVESYEQEAKDSQWWAGHPYLSWVQWLVFLYQLMQSGQSWRLDKHTWYQAHPRSSCHILSI